MRVQSIGGHTHRHSINDVVRGTHDMQAYSGTLRALAAIKVLRIVFRGLYLPLARVYWSGQRIGNYELVR